MPEKIYTTYQIGKFCQVNIRTVIRWIETGKLKAYTTPGGHRRVKWSDLINFLTQNRMPIPKELEEGRKKKILVVDDDHDFLEIAKKMLEKIPDAEVKTTSSGFDAGILVAEWNPDIILLDFIIPDLDGFEVTKKLKSNPKLKKIPIIAVTSISDPEKLEEVKNCGVDAVITKPIQPENFLKRVDKYLYMKNIL
ncbi:MAG: histidine kinase [Spirochaetes bacterium]|nr:MAG: histidine kinase [Spirochaetota bacterium]RKY01779.1 MAG: histidine kinase [Spirochaetota bacterium]